MKIIKANVRVCRSIIAFQKIPVTVLVLNDAKDQDIHYKLLEKAEQEAVHHSFTDNSQIKGFGTNRTYYEAKDVIYDDIIA